MAKPIHVLNGPNLNLLGTREPDIYGAETLTDIEARLNERYSTVDQVFRQTNHEGELVDWIQDASRSAAVLLLNAGAYTHTSVAVHDALRACDCPVIEVHLSNPAAREAFRHQSYVAPVAHGTIAGFGAHGYELAMDAALRLIETHSGEL
ncbi:MAG: type II 3-dehydroquinate dehydratase [Pseudomonadota bacterium]